jgi:hypothetical protein
MAVMVNQIIEKGPTAGHFVSRFLLGLRFATLIRVRFWPISFMTMTNFLSWQVVEVAEETPDLPAALIRLPVSRSEVSRGAKCGSNLN